jgi:hypothetical protein
MAVFWEAEAGIVGAEAEAGIVETEAGTADAEAGIVEPEAELPWDQWAETVAARARTVATAKRIVGS